jgi:hypothetical protein
LDVLSLRVSESALGGSSWQRFRPKSIPAIQQFKRYSNSSDTAIQLQPNSVSSASRKPLQPYPLSSLERARVRTGRDDEVAPIPVAIRVRGSP